LVLGIVGEAVGSEAALGALDQAGETLGDAQGVGVVSGEVGDPVAAQDLVLDQGDDLQEAAGMEIVMEVVIHMEVQGAETDMAEAQGVQEAAGQGSDLDHLVSASKECLKQETDPS
jgi:hypothetical protein